jgi:hypothetical protein
LVDCLVDCLVEVARELRVTVLVETLVTVLVMLGLGQQVLVEVMTAPGFNCVFEGQLAGQFLCCNVSFSTSRGTLGLVVVDVAPRIVETVFVTTCVRVLVVVFLQQPFDVSATPLPIPSHPCLG